MKKKWPSAPTPGHIGWKWSKLEIILLILSWSILGIFTLILLIWR